MDYRHLSTDKPLKRHNAFPILLLFMVGILVFVSVYVQKVWFQNNPPEILSTQIVPVIEPTVTPLPLSTATPEPTVMPIPATPIATPLTLTQEQIATLISMALALQVTGEELDTLVEARTEGWNKWNEMQQEAQFTTFGLPLAMDEIRAGIKVIQDGLLDSNLNRQFDRAISANIAEDATRLRIAADRLEPPDEDFCPWYMVETIRAAIDIAEVKILALQSFYGCVALDFRIGE